MKNIEQRVIEYISKYWSYDINKLRLNTTLDDIGMFGDDKYDFLIDFGNEYNLDMIDFPFGKYIDDEGDILSIGFFLKKLFKGESKKQEKITIQMLINWVKENKA